MSGSKGTSEKVVLLIPDGIFQTEIRVPFLQSHLSVVFRSFFGKWSWFAQIVNAIPGRNLPVLNFAYHLPKPKTDRLANVNVVADSDFQIRGGGVINTYIHTHLHVFYLESDPEIRGGPVSKKIFSALLASVWSKNKGGGPSGLLPWIRHWNGKQPVSPLYLCRTGKQIPLRSGLAV